MAKRQKQEFIFVFLIFALVLFMLIVSHDYHPLAKQFPQLVAGVVLILLVWELVVMILRRGEKKEAPKKNELFEELPRKTLIKRWLAIGLSLAAYVLLLPTLGFVVMTSLLILSLLWFFEIRRPFLLLLYTGFTVGMLYMVFVKILYVPLPSGVLW